MYTEWLESETYPFAARPANNISKRAFRCSVRTMDNRSLSDAFASEL